MVGAGGIGAPAAWALAEAAQPIALTVIDDDVVELSNLHRQILYEDADVGRPKLEALSRALRASYPGLSLATIEGRALPETVMDLVTQATVILDACDNYATRFLLADAARLAGRPIVHAASVRWSATVMAVGPAGRPCYRCLFEDLPSGEAVDCATAGVAGPVCGVAGAVAADRVLRILEGDATAYGSIVSYDGWRDRLREVAVAPRSACALCGDVASIGDIDASRYLAPVCSLG